MRIDIITLFPEMIEAALDHSIVKRARERNLITVNVIDLRDYTDDRHRTADDIPYGGGGGMIMKIEPIARALQALTQVNNETESSITEDFAKLSTQNGEVEVKYFVAAENETAAIGVPSERQDAANVSAPVVAQLFPPSPRIVLTDPRGPRFTQRIAQQWASEPHLILLCGHYEGVDERVRKHLVTDEISIGDYILTGGELPVLIIVDALTRLQSGALGDADAPDKDTFADDLLEYPHYTRPREYNGWSVPDVLLSGNHAQIERWHRWHQLTATRDRRYDLFVRLELSKQDVKLLQGGEPTGLAQQKTSRHETSDALRDEAHPELEQASEHTQDNA